MYRPQDANTSETGILRPRRKFGWPIHGAFVLFALVLGLLDHWLSGWGVPIAVGGGVIGISIIVFRRFWSGSWFWLTIAAMTALQVPLMILARPLMAQFNIVFLLPLAMVDAFLIALVVNWMSPKNAQREDE